MNKKLLLIGGGGHCKSVLDSLLELGHYTEIGIIDKEENIGKSILSIPIIGCDENLIELHNQGYKDAFITVGSIGNPCIRMRLTEELEDIGFHIPNIVDSTAILSKHIAIEKGVYVGKNVVINAGSSIGKGAIINTSSTLEHDCSIGEFAHIAPGTVLCGEVQIGARAHIGAKTIVKQQVKIGQGSLIGLGSVVLHDITENTTAFGNPCREVKKL